MDRKISIKCPHCSATLYLAMREGIDPRKSKITCPMCKRPSILADCKPATPKPVSSPGMEGTIIPGMENGMTGNRPGFCNGVGRLRVVAPEGMVAINQNSLTLNQGANVIGRMSPAVRVECPINVASPRSRLSRQQLVLEVRQIQGRYIHSVKLFKREVNDTYVNNSKLVFGDSVVLSDGDVIHIPECDILFEVTGNG